MYLSRIELDPNKYGTRKAIASPLSLHAAVENCFPSKYSHKGQDSKGGQDGERGRKLWRLDNLRGKLYLLLLSPEKPDFSLFTDQFCSSGVVGETKDYSVLLARIEEGQRWNFRLRGNATHSINEAEGERGKVYAHVSVGRQREWLVKKAPLCGFKLDERFFDVTKTDQLRFWRREAKYPITLGVAEFEGELAVADAEAFRIALVNGVGRAKAYGCGLLTIARRA